MCEGGDCNDGVKLNGSGAGEGVSKFLLRLELVLTIFYSGFGTYWIGSGDGFASFVLDAGFVAGYDFFKISRTWFLVFVIVDGKSIILTLLKFWSIYIFAFIFYWYCLIFC